MNSVKVILKSMCLTIFVLNPAWAANHWQCIAQDSENKRWIAQDPYERVANSKALDACKKSSRTPSTCTVPPEACTYLKTAENTPPTVTRTIIHSVSAGPSRSLWQCMALDWRAKSWLNRPAPNQDAAALSAKAFCQRHSSLPGTCYVNLITCKNIVR